MWGKSILPPLPFTSEQENDSTAKTFGATPPEVLNLRCSQELCHTEPPVFCVVY